MKMNIQSEKRLFASRKITASISSATNHLLNVAKSDPYDSEMMEAYQEVADNEGKRVADAAAVAAMLKTNLLDRMLEAYEEDSDQYDDPSIPYNLYEFIFLSSVVDTGKPGDRVANALARLLDIDEIAEALQREFKKRL